MADIEKIVEYLQENKAITLLEEIATKIPDITPKQLNNPQVLKALENNKIEMKLMLKSKLYKNGTTQSLLELNSMLNEETNNDRTSKYISKLVREWASNELQ